MIWLLLACVVRYGEVEKAPAIKLSPVETVDFTQIAEDLEDLIGKTDDNDKADRLNAAQDLLRQAKRMNSASQKSIHDYLSRLVKIEQRNQTMQIQLDDEQSFSSMTDISDEIVTEDIILTDENDEVLEAASGFIQQRQFQLGLAELEKCKSLQCWDKARPIWEKTRDEFIALQIKNAQVELVRARLVNPLRARLKLSLQVEQNLVKLLQSYPNSPYRTSVDEVLVNVRKEIVQVEQAIKRSLRKDGVSN